MNRPFLQNAEETYLDFKALRCTRIEELNCYFRELVHEPTGAHVIHIENDDPENLFCLSFRTLPQNSRGVPHVLEHVVLCGSKKFPVKDPFFSMTRRSLNTYMNALTGSDFTCYPAATQVEQDFYNLLSVYVDAVFHPEIKQLSFLQEGCRLEFTTPNDLDSPLQFKGIVYNEMKGSISPESKLCHLSLEALFPDLPYANNSGGDPKDIPHLTFEELVAFHKTYYHPSRCLFFFYGSFPLKKHLDYLQENVFCNVEPKLPLPPLPKQPRFTQPKTQHLTYAVSEEQLSQAKAMVSFGWLTCAITEQAELLALSVLDSVLMESDASPLKKAFLESGLCMQADALMDPELSEVPFILTFKGCKEEDVDKLKDFVFETLRLLSEKPFSDKLIQAAIHQIELSRTEISQDHGPFGLNLFFRSALTKQQGGDPLYALRIHSLFEELLEKTQDPLYLPGLIKKYFLDNPHHVQTVLLPDSGLEKKEIDEETKLLQTIQKSLSQTQKEEICRQTNLLEKMQKEIEEQDVDCLPKITLDDVPLLPKDFPLKHQEKKSSLQIFHHACFTNSLVYADLIFDMPSIEVEEIPYVQLLLSFLPSVGSGGRDYVETLQEIMAYTGGIYTSSSLHVQAKDRKAVNPAFSIRGKALGKNVDKLFTLMNDIAQSADFTDSKRVKELVEQVHSSLQNRVAKSALRYGANLALSGYGEASYFSNQASGIPYFHFIEQLAADLPKTIPLLIDKLTALKDKLFSFHNTHLVLSCDQALYEEILKKNPQSFFSFPQKPFSPWKHHFPITPIASQGKIITSQVAYNIQAYNVAPYIHPHASALSVASQLFEHVVLHNRIREIGGAYGAGASYNSFTGNFYFYSYRDPQISSTFKAFEEAIQTIAEGDFTNQDLEEAKISIVQQMDSPVAPGSQAILAYNLYRDGKDKQMREAYRTSLLNLTAADVQNTVKSEFISPQKASVKISVAGKDLFTRQAPELTVSPL
ncbi:MAG: insulinase family protein [Rhabdochlamydiaceae bacterium]|nr:insulinase family protein [Rhabdochlamydiaceae bacterium]